LLKRNISKDPVSGAPSVVGRMFLRWNFSAVRTADKTSPKKILTAGSKRETTARIVNGRRNVRSKTGNRYLRLISHEEVGNQGGCNCGSLTTKTVPTTVFIIICEYSSGSLVKNKIT
jgi:hypothetical protein